MKQRDNQVILVLLLLVLGMYLPPLFTGRVLAEDPTMLDVSFNVMPNVCWAAQSYGRGEFPLWNPHTHCGMPHLGYSHSGGLYPVNMLIFGALPYPWAISVTIIFHSLLMGWLFFLLLRDYGLDPRFAGAASLLFIFSGSFFYLRYVPWAMGSSCGLLVAWISLRRLLRRPGLLAFGGSSLGVAWCGIAGDVELLAYGLMALSLLLLLESEPGLRSLIRRIALITLAVIAGFLVLSPLALSTMETVRFSIRGPWMPYELKFINQAEYWPYLIPTMLWPFQYYINLNPASAYNSGFSVIYQGFLTPALLVWGILAAWRQKTLRPLVVTWLGFLLLMVVRELDLGGRFLNQIPVLRSLHYSGKGLVLLHALALIAGFRILSVKLGGAGKDRSPRAFGAILVLCGALMVLLQPWCLGGAERYVLGLAAVAGGAASLIKRKGQPLLSARGTLLLALLLMVLETLTLAGRCFPRTDPARYDFYPELDKFAHRLAPETRYAVFESLLSESATADPPIFGSFELASAAGNLIGPSRVQPARIFLYLSQIYRDLIQTDQQGQKAAGGWSMTNPGTLDLGRMHLFNLAGPRLILGRNLAIPYTTPYSLLRPGALQWKVSEPSGEERRKTAGAGLQAPALMEAELTGFPGDQLALSGRAEGPGWMIAMAQPFGRHDHDLLNARFLNQGEDLRQTASLQAFSRSGRLSLSWVKATDREAGLEISSLDLNNNSRPFQRSEVFGTVEVFHNREALPRAFIVHQPVVIKKLEERLEWMDDPAKFFPSRQVLLEEETAEVRMVKNYSRNAGRVGAFESAEIKSYGPHRVEMAARLALPGFLVFTDAYFPGWEAQVVSPGGPKPARVLAADLAFRAVFLPEGEHRIIWTYRPWPFHLGLWAGAASLVSLMLAGLAAIIRKTARV